MIVPCIHFTTENIPVVQKNVTLHLVRPFHSGTCSNELQISFEASVLFTNEASFSREGIFNLTTAIRGQQRTHITRTPGCTGSFRLTYGLTFSRGGSSNRSYILPGHLTGPRYLIFWNQFCQKGWTEHTLALRLVLPCGSSKMEPRTFQYFCSRITWMQYVVNDGFKGGPVH
ncbi:hypothetical protein TNCV_2098421 [Trichonephila clavipes]|nr:hypothetical protein TNCV_2098421 [Trichonephila clavipes]